MFCPTSETAGVKVSPLELSTARSRRRLTRLGHAGEIAKYVATLPYLCLVCLLPLADNCLAPAGAGQGYHIWSPLQDILYLQRAASAIDKLIIYDQS